MRNYITEKVGILESFQIIFAIAIISLGFYAFTIDSKWNRKVDKEGIMNCQEVNFQIYKVDHDALIETECKDVLAIKGKTECDQFIQNFYLNGAVEKFKVRKPNNQSVDVKKFVKENMERRQPSEITFLVLSTLVSVFLILHMICASFTSLIEFRTKWNAAIQGIVLFSSGFSAMLLAISTNTIDNKYVLLSGRYRICSILRFCDRTFSKHPELSSKTANTVNKALDGLHACQVVRIKEAVCILLIIIIGISIAMILLAMDLTTKYEQESEEEEMQIADSNVGNFEDDDNIEFAIITDTYDEGSGTEAPTDSAVIIAKKAAQAGHRRSSTTVIAEYLATHREKPGGNK